MTRTAFNEEGFTRLEWLRQQRRTMEAREVRLQLIKRNIRVARALGWKFEALLKVSGARLIAFRLLVTAIDAFDPGSGRPFTRFAIKSIRRQLLRLWRRQHEQAAQRPAAIATERDLGHLAELLGQLDAVDRFDANVVRMYYGIGRPSQNFAEIGRELGLPNQLISRHVRRGVKQLRQFAEIER